MAVTKSFTNMVNEYLSEKLLKTELLKRDWFLQNIPQDTGWKGGSAIVPIRNQRATSVEFGSLAADTDVSEDGYGRGEVDPVELYGTMIFNQGDLMDHEGKIPENTFLKILPNTVEDFVSYMKDCTSIAMADGYLAKLTADGNTGGTGLATVDFIDRFEIDQKVTLKDGDTSAADYYVTAVNVDTKVITLSATRGGAAADISAFTTAQSAKIYHPGQDTLSFNNLRGLLLSSANGGDAAIHGLTKTASPHYQAVNVSGAAFTATNFLDEIFDAYVDIQQKARGGRCSTILMSLKNLGVIMKLVEVQKGGFNVAPGQTKISEYGWTEIMLGSPAGVFLKFAGIQELADDVVYFLDMKSLEFKTKHMFKRIKSPSGDDIYVKRATTGYQWVLDYALWGNLVCKKPANNGAIHSLSLSY